MCEKEERRPARRRAGERTSGDPTGARDLREINDFWMEVVRDTEEKITNRLKASELRAKSAETYLSRTAEEPEKTIRVVMEGEAAELAE